MKFDVEGAKKAGYSDQEIQSFLSQKAPSEGRSKSFDSDAAKAAGYSDEEISDFLKKNEISKTRSVISAPVKGAIKGAEELSSLADPAQLILNQIMPKKESLLSKLSEKVLPTKDEAAERVLERIGKNAPIAALGAGGVIPALTQAITGGISGEVAKEEGIGETGQGIAEAVGMGLPAIAKGLGKGAISLLKSPVERFSSGLTKPRAVGAKLAERAIMSPARQEKSIAKLNEEASKLARQSVEKELPLAKQIEQGIDFEGQFEKNFGALQSMAEKANPDIDISPVSKFMSETASKYRGIPKLHGEAAKIKSEVKAFGNHAPTDLKTALRTYRSNNKKIKGIYETSRLTGKQQEYVDFLVDYNRNLAKSFEDTLPKDSAWIKEFKDLNKGYKNYKDTLKTLDILKPIYGDNVTPSNVAKLADDAKTYKKLQLAMGDKGASEISQIAKDLRTATESVKKIPAKDLKWYEGYLPLSIFVPGIHVPAGAVATKKGIDFARRGYGWFLSTPARRASYSKALKGLIENNRSLYIKGAEELKKSVDSEEE